MTTTNGTSVESFQDQVVWITGASSGIGEALAKAFAQQGARVVLSARNQRELQRVIKECVAAGASRERLLLVPLDVLNYEALPAAMQEVLITFGRIDMLINNAGTSQRSFCLDTDLQVYRTLFELNVIAQIALTKTVLPVMVGQGSGQILVTASVAGKVGVPLRTGYCAAKHAVMGFFDALRTEVTCHGIKVTTIVPGFVRTNIGANALTGSGAPTGKPDADIETGMDVTECARVILRGITEGVEEISVGSGPEMGLLDLKRQDATATFRLLEAMAADVRSKQQQQA